MDIRTVCGVEALDGEREGGREFKSGAITSSLNMSARSFLESALNKCKPIWLIQGHSKGSYKLAGTAKSVSLKLAASQ